MTLKDIALKHLAKWPLYSKDHFVKTLEVCGGVWLGYSTTNSPRTTLSRARLTHFDVNILNDVFFVLDICVEPQHRGKGHGDALYKVLEEIAAEAGCHKVQMTASGWTHTGELRMDYLLRRGYQQFGNIEVVKDVA